MSSCCQSHNKVEKMNKIISGEKIPKSFIGKYLYNLGKKEYEKETKIGNNKRGCCQHPSS